jgi:DNA polymerase-1
MLLQVHDELVFDAHNSELEKYSRLNTEMENAFKLDVPLTVELGMGKDWLKHTRKYSVVVVVVVGTIIIVLGFDFTLQRINSD